MINRVPQSSDHPETPSHGLATVAGYPRHRIGLRLRGATSPLRGRHRPDREAGYSSYVPDARCTTLAPRGDAAGTRPLTTAHPHLGKDDEVPPYREWGRQGLPAWVFWAIIGGVLAIVVGLLVSR